MEEKDKELTIRKCAEMLERIISDVTVPRNIRKSAETLKDELLNGEGSIAMRAASAISKSLRATRICLLMRGRLSGASSASLKRFLLKNNCRSSRERRRSVRVSVGEG